MPTSLVHMIPSTRGVLPRRPDAVTSTARRSVATEAFQGPSTTAETPREPVLLHAAGLLAHGIACEVARRVREKRKLFLGPSRASPRRTGVGSPRARKRALPTAWRTVKPPSLSGRRSRRPSLAVFGGALSTDSPISKCCSHGTLLHLGLHASHLNICYFHQDLHRTELRRVLAHALPRSDRVLLLDPLCGDRASTGRDASAPSIFGVR